MKLKKVIYILLLISSIVVAIFIAFNSANKNKTVASTTIDTSNNSLLINDNTIANQINDNNVTKIPDDYFMTTLNDIYINYKDYIGKEIEYEGFIFFPENENYSMVVGRKYYCCGYDSSVVGFECKTDKKFDADTWVKVIGTLAVNDSNPKDIYPYIDVIEIEKKDIRGTETVYN